MALKLVYTTSRHNKAKKINNNIKWWLIHEPRAWAWNVDLEMDEHVHGWKF